MLYLQIMLDSHTIKNCKENPEIRDLKIKNIEHAIDQAELMFLKRKISDSRGDLEILYLMKI